MSHGDLTIVLVSFHTFRFFRVFHSNASHARFDYCNLRFVDFLRLNGTHRFAEFFA